MKTRTSSFLFGLVVTLCLAQIAWWIYFQVRETRTVERAAALIQQGETEAAARELGADESGSLTEHTRRRRIMFLSEGATLGLLVLIAVVFFYARMRRELHMRAAQKRFLTGATHELKTPLATLRLGLESMAAGSMPEAKRATYVDAMIQQVNRLERDINNLLTAASLNEGERPLSLDAGTLAEDVHQATRELEPRYRAAGVALEVHTANDVHIRRDPAAIRLVLRNLLDNALKYSSTGDRVDIDLRCVEDRAELRVTDTGAGMKEEEVAHVFDRFYRGNSSEHVGGAGLGLHLVQQLVAAHGGTVEAYSAGPGSGSAFTVRLPCKEHAS